MCASDKNKFSVKKITVRRHLAEDMWSLIVFEIEDKFVGCFFWINNYELGFFKMKVNAKFQSNWVKLS